MKARFHIVIDPENPEAKKEIFEIDLRKDWASSGYDRFVELINKGFYDQCRFFRVVRNFVVQFGINGDPGITSLWQNKFLKDDTVQVSNSRGTISFATSGPNSRTTQVFINLVDNSRLDKMGFSPFGEVSLGMDVVDRIYSGYGESPNQVQIQLRGNDYLISKFPKLSYIDLVELIEADSGSKATNPISSTYTETNIVVVFLFALLVVIYTVKKVFCPKNSVYNKVEKTAQQID